MKPSEPRFKIAVVGAGWAGLSAAVQLARRADVTVFEAGRRAGGRARRVDSSGVLSFLDNGQHILLGAYHGVLGIMRQIGVDEKEVFRRMPLTWYMAEGMNFQTASLPKPWHLLLGVLRAKNLAFSEKMALLKSMRVLKKYGQSDAADIDVAAWLQQNRVSHKLQIEFWQPLVYGALNTPLEQAGLKTLYHVLHDGVWAEKQDSDYLLPKRDLSSVLAEPACSYLRRRGANIRLENRVNGLECLPDGKVAVDGEPFDAVILAVAPYHAAALMPSETPDNIQTAYRSMKYHAITTVYLRYPEAVSLPAPMTGVKSGTAQWLFDRRALGLSDREMVAVISVSDGFGDLTRDEWIDKIDADIKKICPHLSKPSAAKVMTEKRATIAATVDRCLPDTTWLHHQNIYPAGDYLHPRYPATLEAAVQSGFTAADLCLTELANQKRKEYGPT
ncbi:TPA: hydroxysqualene dehydroxylase HpnE [Neisseria weaveri]